MIELDVKDMTCGHCVSAVTRAVRAVDPGADVQVDLAGKRVRVQGRSSVDQLVRALGDAGYAALPASGPAPAAAKRGGCCCT